MTIFFEVFFKSKYALAVRVLMCCIGFILLSGCSKTKGAISISEQSQVSKEPDAGKITSLRSNKDIGVKLAKISVCVNELKALQKISPALYKKRKEEFDTLMKGAAVYDDLRTDITESIRESVDAMYIYKTGLLCSVISQELLRSLSGKG